MKRIAWFLVLFCAVYAAAVILPAVIFAGQEGGAAAAPAEGQFGVQVVINYLAMLAIQWAKKNKSVALGWIGANTPWASRVAAGVAAAAAAAGITGTFEGGVLTVSGLTLAGVGHFLLHYGQNWVGIKVLYKFLNPSAPAWDGQDRRTG